MAVEGRQNHRSEEMASGSLARILLDQHARYPGLEPQDVYKLLLQAALGSEHATPDPASARDRLKCELAEMGSGPDDPLFDPLSPCGELVRVHLRPYLEQGRDMERLLGAFLRTGQEWHGSTDRLREYLGQALSLAEQGLLPLPAQALSELFQKWEFLGFPAVHHSQPYRQLYRPAYRVVARSLMEE